MGRLGEHRFPKGAYAYVGSALGPGGLRARVGRHLETGRRLRWHIDYLRRAADVRQVWTGIHNRRLEHRWASILARMDGAAIPAARFGASDCRCPAHLFRFPDIPSFTEFKKRAMMLSSETGGVARIRIP